MSKLVIYSLWQYCMCPYVRVWEGGSWECETVKRCLTPTSPPPPPAPPRPLAPLLTYQDPRESKDSKESDEPDHFEESEVAQDDCCRVAT